MKSIYGKLILGFLISILFSFSIAGYFSLRKNADELGRVTVKELETFVNHVATLVDIVDEEELQSVLSSYATTSQTNFYIESQGHLMSYGEMTDRQMTHDSYIQLLANVGTEIAFNEGTLYKYAKSFEINGQTYIVLAQRDIGDREMIFINSAIIAVFCMLGAGSVMFLILADIIVKPISRLNKATNELSKGNYRVRVHYAGNDEIARLNQSFNQMAQRLVKQEELRQQFISDVSHEFQTPLTAIQGFATILKNEELPLQQRQKYADIILFHSKRLSTLSKNMLQLTLLEGEDVSLACSEFSLIEQLNRVIETHDNMALSKNIEIEFQPPKNDIVIEADESRLEQVWINLINNAIKYTNRDGVVTVTVKKTSKEVEVSVADTGVGMSKEDISHIFERFYRRDKSRSVEGNGLGLSIVKKIIDLHLGTIDVKSREDGGSQFIVKIPQEKTLSIADRLIKKDKDSHL